MGEPTIVVAPALAPVASLGVVLAGCPDCRRVIGLAGAPGLAAALAAHQRGCPKRQRPRPTAAEDQVCPGCGCEAELRRRAGGWRCGDCLAELLLADPAIPGAAARSRSRQPVHDPTAPRQVVAHTARRHPAATDQAVVA